MAFKCTDVREHFMWRVLASGVVDRKVVVVTEARWIVFGDRGARYAGFEISRRGRQSRGTKWPKNRGEKIVLEKPNG